ncbi:helix-turn-helix domain-containing protein [Pseudonocardia sp. H11422]|uniref:helix-turn-helix domain-containing protein n=1 Tax=Pseudonocardia sp. H11422 TaxID=2835866 RepID=UPI001BDC5DC7|nr:helix-turn-helix domain-containing protein [Pseudonocardia sp. H11422]
MQVETTSDAELTLGRRIELLRRRRGLSRRTLASLIGYSAEWLRQVEKGERPADRLSTLLRMADVLRVGDVPSFLGLGPAVPKQRVSPEIGISDLRMRLFVPGSADPVDDGAVQRWRGQLEAAWSTWQNSPRRYSRTKADLMRLLAEVRNLNTGAIVGGVEVFAHTHRLAAAFLRQVGDPSLALLAIERGASAGVRSRDPLTAAACAGGFAATLLRLGFAVEARRVCEEVESRLEPEGEDVTPEVVSVRGAVQLTAAEAAAIDNDHHAAERLLTQARVAAEGLGEDRNDLASSFGPTDVAIHAVRIELFLGRTRRALRLAEQLDVDGRASIERQARHHLTLARAHSRERDPVAATFALLQAEDACAEEVRFNVDAKSVIQDVLRQDNARVRRELWGLAERAALV